MNKTQCSLSVDRALDLLASSRRRRLLRYLSETPDAVVDRAELARGLEPDDEYDDETLLTVLSHHHLPKLADEAVIEYDHRSGAVRPTRAVEKLQPLLDACEEFEASLDQSDAT